MCSHDGHDGQREEAPNTFAVLPPQARLTSENLPLAVLETFNGEPPPVTVELVLPVNRKPGTDRNPHMCCSRHRQTR